MDQLPIEVVILATYVFGVAVPHVAVAAWEGWTGNRYDSEEWGGLFFVSLLWPALFPVVLLMAVALIAARTIRAAANLARTITGERPHD